MTATAMRTVKNGLRSSIQRTCTCIPLFGRFLAATERLCSEILQASLEEDVNTPRRLFPSFYSFPKISYF